MGKETKPNNSLRGMLILAGIGLFFLVVLISSVFGKKGLLEIYRARKNYQSLLIEVRQLEEKKNRLLREIEELEKNPLAVDREAREKLWLLKPEEKVIIPKKE